MNDRILCAAVIMGLLWGGGCAPVEYSVVIVQASQAISAAESAGAACTQSQVDALSPVTRQNAPESGTEIVSTEETKGFQKYSEPKCSAPYEYYSALEYMSKAREEVGYSDYEIAIEYAREARTHATKAAEISRKMAREAGR